MNRIFEVTKATHFDAAHHFPMGPENSPHRRMHGHSFVVEATVRGERTGDMGFVVDLTKLEAGLKAAAAELDHTLLNDHAGLERPSLEALCLWFADRLKPAFPGLSRITLIRPTIGERCVLEV
jgi:6-pyruvoyltetrahydropterin/6-carboxytetrahydropterin synthase